MSVPLQVLTHSIKQLRRVQLQSSKCANQQRKLLAVLLLAELHGAALQEVCACAKAARVNPVTPLAEFTE